MSFDKQTGKRTMVHPYYGILQSDTKEQNIPKGKHNLNESPGNYAR